MKVNKLKIFHIFILLLLCSPERKQPDKEKFNFPDGFLWGVALSGFQTDMGPGVEPDENSDWWRWFHSPENEEKGIVPKDDKPELGPAFWRFYKDDIKRAKEILKINAFRYSIEWSRIFPSSTTRAKNFEDLEKVANTKALEKYKDIISTIRQEGLEPYITLNHFTLPLWIHDPLCEGGSCPEGWLDDKTPEEFAKYCGFVARKFGHLVDLWATMNEPIVVSTLGYLVGQVGVLAGAGAFPPARSSPDDFVKVTLNLIWAHAFCSEAIKENDRGDADGDGKSALVSIIYNINWFEPYSESEEDKTATEHAWFWQVWWYLDAVVEGKLDEDGLKNGYNPKFVKELQGKTDIIGINYYGRMKIARFDIFPEYQIDFLPVFDCPVEKETASCPWGANESGIEIYPPGITKVVLLVWKRYRIPIIISENGTSDADDSHRPWFLVSHIARLSEILGRVKLLGYFHWTLLDNLEWMLGFDKKFGLFEVDFNSPDRRRTPRKSAFLYGKIANFNGIPQELYEYIKVICFCLERKSSLENLVRRSRKLIFKIGGIYDQNLQAWKNNLKKAKKGFSFFNLEKL